MELRLPQLPCPARRNLPRQSPHPDAACHQRRQSNPGSSSEPRPIYAAQIEATPELQPQKGIRQSPVAGAVLANADIDHVLGLLLLRELQPLRDTRHRFHPPYSQRRQIMFAMLQRVPGQVQLDRLCSPNSIPVARTFRRRFGTALPRFLAGHTSPGVRFGATPG